MQDHEQVHDEDEVDATSMAFLDVARTLMGVTLRAVAASPLPLTVPQHRVLVMMSTEGPRRIGAMAADLGVNQSNASRLVDRLVSQDLARRCADPVDRRASLIELTDRGRRVLEVVGAHRLRSVRAVVKDMPAHTRSSARQGLLHFATAAQGAGVGKAMDVDHARSVS